MYRDIIIVGGGASGLVCAIKSAENNPKKKILILEKQSRVGRKLMSTGNGRCNLTNVNADKNYYHGTFSKYIDVIFEKYSAEKVIDFFEKNGLIIKTDSEGRVYPYSNHASSVLDVLRLKAEELNIEIMCEHNVTKVSKKGDTFSVLTENEKFSCKKLVMCTGSKASPKLGADASGIDLLKNLGHKIVPLSPALCAIPVDSPYLSALKGVRSTGKVSLYSSNKLIKEEYGEIQFTEKALSGICVFNLSSYLSKDKNYEIVVSLLPNLDDRELLYLLMERKKAMYNQMTENFLTGIFVKSLNISLLKECNIKPTRKIGTLEYDELAKLALAINNRRFKVINKLSFDNAQVVSGGVKGDEISPETMESKLVKNLYICGEAVDIHGDCGGFNLQFAFASGLIAGENL